MEVLAFASFAILVIGWLIAPSKTATPMSRAEEREAA